MSSHVIWSLIGAAIGLLVFGGIFWFATHLPETYRKNMGYKRIFPLSNLEPTARRRILTVAVAFVVFGVVAGAGIGYALPSAFPNH